MQKTKLKFNQFIRLCRTWSIYMHLYVYIDMLDCCQTG